MMIPYQNPDDYVSVFEHDPCTFHKIAPGEPYSGCTCVGKYFTRRATPAEREANIKARHEREALRAKAMRAVGLIPE